MKIHNGDKQSLIISSNDVAITGSDNQTLTDVIKDHTTEINDLQKNVKWLYKYGGTGSKGSGGGEEISTKIDLNCDIIFDNVTINTTINKSSKIILKDSNASESNLIIQLKSARPGVEYSIRVSQQNLASSSSQVQYLIGSGSSRVQLTLDNEFTVSKLVSNLYDEGQINIQLFGVGSTNVRENFTILYVKNAYSISLSLVNNNGDEIIKYNPSFTNDLYSNNVNNGLKLRINYNVQTSNQIPFNINNFDMFEQNDYKINEDKKGFGQVDIPIKESFYKDTNGSINYNSIGYNSFTITFEIPRDETINQEGRNLAITFPFNYIPDDDVFFKILPSNEIAKIYRYTEPSFQTAIEKLQQYEKIYNAYTKLVDVTSLDISLLNEEDKYNVAQILNINIAELSINEIFSSIKNYLIDFEANNYVFGVGSINFNIWAYNGIQTAGTVDVKCNLSEKNSSVMEEVNIGITDINLRTKRTVSFIIHEPGVYVMSIYSKNTRNRIEYYFYVFDKSSNLNWYDQNIVNVKNYYRSGSTTAAFDAFKNKPYIQHYSNKVNNIIRLADTRSQVTQQTRDDVLVAIGIQYSSINNVNNKILSINCESNAGTTINLTVYQNKILINNTEDTKINIFLPKETNYNAANNDNYHLLVIYKRYIYTYEANTTSTFELCAYIDGVLEGVSETFTTDNSVWDSIYMHPGNYSINLCELSYFTHNKENNEKRLSTNGSLTYLDDLAISEYYYKFVNTYKNNPSEIPTFDGVNELLSILRHFEETPEGMIEVADIGSGEVTSDNEINQIASKFNVATLLLTCKENSKNEFFNYFAKSYSENDIDNIKPLDIQNIYYSAGKQELKLVEIPSELNGENPWTIKIQGSSTGQFYSKNLTLGIKPNINGSDNKLGIFTPNFKYLSHNSFISPTTSKDVINEAKSTFLPETEFTLKADCVDSTHSNNNAIGAFVNDNTTQFNINFNSGSNPINDNNPYQHYIKNCLLGFPVLVFIHTYFGDESKTYFLGIYNFNLGRGSYFNMGYYSPDHLDRPAINTALEKGDGNNFIVTYINLGDKTSLPVDDGVIVAEIQGGAHYNDFSQYDQTILLPQEANDAGSMFGDFVPKYNPKGNQRDDAKIRYHLPRLVSYVSNAGGYIFENKLGKHLGEYGVYDDKKDSPYAYNKYIDKGERSSIFDSANQVPNYRVQYVRRYGEEDKNLQYVVKNPTIKNAASQEYLTKLITWGDDETPNKPILDYVSCAEYYTTCMAFGLIDSVMKNLNVKTWDAVYDENNYEDQTSTWYVAFYDMDTSFGRNNMGENVSHFAYSDYWNASATELKGATIYRDFYPASNSGDPNVSGQKNPYIGYDIPSSYLFAIAKYANIGLGETGDGDNSNTHGAKLPNMQSSLPQNIWARWRATSISENSGMGTLGLGELRNAEAFVNKYFVRNLDEIPEQIWNMNYRFKYLKRIEPNDAVGEKIWKEAKNQNGSFENKNYTPFKGKGINFVKEWLNNRLHILDAYFNLDGVGYQIQKLEYETPAEYESADELTKLGFTKLYGNDQQTEIGYSWHDIQVPKKYENSNEYAWVPTGIKDSTPIVSGKNLASNSDIWVVQDIFSSGGTGRQYAQNITLNVKAQELSPLTVTETSGQTKYLLKNPDNVYTVKAQATGLQYIVFGGSPAWTYIENMNPLIVAGSLNVYSDRLESLILTNGICSTYNINKMRSLKTVSIKKGTTEADESTSFSGSLSFIVNNDEDNFPDLTKIELIRTNISLEVNGEGVQDINLSYTSCDHISILNCTNLQSVNLSNTYVENYCEIKPAWTNNININSSQIKKLSISPKDVTATERRITISDDSMLSELTLNDFTHIEIKNCRNLENLTINSIDQVKSLKIIYCNTIQDENKNFKKLKYTFTPSLNAENKQTYTNYEITDDGDVMILYNDLNCLNLGGAVSLELLSIEGTRGIDIIDFGEIEGEDYEYTNDQNVITHIKGINLATRAFNSTSIKTLITSASVNENDQPLALFINGPSTFSNCLYEYGSNQLFVKAHDYETGNEVTSLASMFSISDTNIISSKLNIIKISAILGNASYPDYKTMIYENKNNIKDLNYMFYNQTGVRIDGDNWTDNINNLKLLSLKSFSYAQDISYIYANCNINKLSADIFGEGNEYLGSSLDQNKKINITSFISTSATIDIHTFKYIINKISSFISTEERPMGLKLCDIINENNIALNINQPLLVKELFKTRMPDGSLQSIQLPNIVNIIGFNIEGKLDWDKAFLAEDDGDQFIFPNLNTVKNSFNRSSRQETKYNEINDNINNWGLDKKLTSIPTIKNSFNISLITPINYYKVINIDLYGGIIPATATEFNMPKYIKENDFINLLKLVNNNRLYSLDYKFYNIVILKDNENDNEFKTYDANVTSPYIFTSCNYAFTGMTFKTYSVVDETIILSNDVIPIKLTSDSLKYFTNCTMWDYAFANITLEQNLPFNLFNQYRSGEIKPENYNNTISSLEGTFSNVKIATATTYFKHEDYDNICIEENGIKKLNVNLYNNGDVLDGSYNPTVELTGLMNSNLLIDNPKCKNVKIINGENNDLIKIYGEEIKNHLILPFDIFWGCGSSANVKKCFANSDFEGILPSRLLEKNKLSVLNDTFNNLLVIPNRITNIYGEDYIYLENYLLNMNTSPTISSNLINGVLSYLKTNLSDGYINKFDDTEKLFYLIEDKRNIPESDPNYKINYIMYQRHKTYVFVPRKFTTQAQINNSFTFKVILPKSVANTPSDNTDNPYNSLYEHYFVFTDTSIPESSIIEIDSSLPGAVQRVTSGENNTDYELYYINPTLSINAGNSNVPRLLDSRKYHNIHYSLMLREPSIDNQHFNGATADELTKQIVRQIRIDISNDENNPYNGNINYFINAIGSNENQEMAPFNIIQKYGISFYNYGMTLTASLRDKHLSGFMNPLLLRFLFGNIFIEDTKYTIDKPSINTTYKPIFGNVEEISKYVKLPYINNGESSRYDNLLTVNFGYENRNYVAISVYNCGGDNESYENYVNKTRYINGNIVYPFNDNDKFI